MNELLIRANIALFQGEYSEVQRLLHAYRAQQPEDPQFTTMARWLEAQAQTDQDSRLEHLRALLAVTSMDDQYTAMAREILAEEDAYAQQGRRRIGLPSLSRAAWVIGLVGLMGLVVVVGGALLSQSGEDPANTVVITATPPPGDPTAAVLDLPDHSQQLVIDGLQARYQGGILQLRAVEERSERIIDSRTEQVLAPVPGARFYALYGIFECRRSICQEPPEAELALQTANQDVIPQRAGVHVYQEAAMQPLALGRTTEGWLVFEMPITFQPEILVITPLLADGARGDPVTITLTDTN